MVPGELIVDAGELALNPGRRTLTLVVENGADRPVQVGSHYHFAETNGALKFDRKAAHGMRLNIASGTAVRFEPGQQRTVELVELAARTGVAQIFVDDDGPGPDGGGQKTDHDELDDQACLHEQAPEAHVMRRCSHSNLFHRLQFPEIQTPGGLDRAAT